MQDLFERPMLDDLQGHYVVEAYPDGSFSMHRKGPPTLTFENLRYAMHRLEKADEWNRYQQHLSTVVEKS